MTPVLGNGTLNGVSLDARHDGDSASVDAAAWAVDFDELRVYATEISVAHIKALASGVGVGASARAWEPWPTGAAGPAPGRARRRRKRRRYRE